jgi:hypothetical protein
MAGPTDEEALRVLEAGLVEYRIRAAGDAGRRGMRMALTGAICLASARLPSDADPTLLEPLYALFNALTDLDHGAIHPALEAKALAHRRPAHSEARQFRARCLIAADLLHQQGMSRADADRTVVTLAHATAKQLGLPITRDNLETWRRSLRRARKRGTAASLFVRSAAMVQSYATRAIKRHDAETVARTLLAPDFPHLLSPQPTA